MMYKFKSKAAGDVLMMADTGDQMLALIGRPPAPQGIIETDALPAAVAALQAAIDGAGAPSEDVDGGTPPPGLRQRLWPMVELLRRSQAAATPVVWGA